VNGQRAARIKKSAKGALDDDAALHSARGKKAVGDGALTKGKRAKRGVHPPTQPQAARTQKSAGIAKKKGKGELWI
jgi:hypothetical protein